MKREIHIEHKKDLLLKIKSYERWNQSPEPEKEDRYDMWTMREYSLKYFVTSVKELAYLLGGTVRTIARHDTYYEIRDIINNNKDILTYALQTITDKYNDPRWWLHEDEVFTIITGRSCIYVPKLF